VPCDTTLAQEQTTEERQREIDKALTLLEAQLTRGLVRMVIGPDGAIAFSGWGDGRRRGIADVCAYRTLAARGSWGLRQAQAAAEMTAGRTVDRAKVAAGVHSHDGGGSWHPGH
jgi:hypothetical protein